MVVVVFLLLVLDVNKLALDTSNRDGTLGAPLICSMKEGGAHGLWGSRRPQIVVSLLDLNYGG
jgi:hypothetical protein